LNLELRTSKHRRDWDKISRRRASIEKARKVLGYEPKMKIKGELNHSIHNSGLMTNLKLNELNKPR
jgi:nucleoside-diphosphate-sugar epimerase